MSVQEASKKRKLEDDAEIDEEVSEAVADPKPMPSGHSITCLPARDIMPKDKPMYFWIEIDSPSFIRKAVHMARYMLDTMTLWLTNNTHSYRLAKQAELQGKGPCKLNNFSGISIDSMDTLSVSMTVARMPLPPSSVKLFGTDIVNGVAVPKEEIGITVSVKALLDTLHGVKDYENLVLFQEMPTEDSLYDDTTSSDRLSVLVVSAAHDSYLMEIPLIATTAAHETVKNWDMQFDLSMSMGDLKETIKRAAGLDAENVRFQMMRWNEQGLIFVISTESRSGGLFRAFQVTYTTALKKDLTSDANYALERMKEATSALAAADKSTSATGLALLQRNIVEAEQVLRRQLQLLYDSLVVPGGAKRNIVFSEDMSVSDCEKEIREAHNLIKEYARQHAHNDTIINAADFLEHVSASSVVEVATSFTKEIRSAPFRKADITKLPCEYDAYFSVKKILDMLKTPQSPSVQLHLPKDSTNPIAIRFDTGGGDYLSFVSFILAPRCDQDA
jgi:hypothetical protein